MPEIFPFRAVRYADPQSLGLRLAPPYDVITPAQREGYAARDPENVVHLILPQGRPGRDERDKYVHAGELYRDWLARGVLARDGAPSLYVLEQRFSWEGQTHTRRGFLARLGLRPFSDGVVLPHEKTLSGPKADRLQLFREVRANLSPIFALYADSGEQALLDASTAGQPGVLVQGEDGVANRLWTLDDPALLREVARRLQPRLAYIADGHHRYETGLAYAAELDAAAGASRPGGAHHTILAYFCSLADPGLVILPTHRVVHSLPSLDAQEVMRRATAFFEVTPATGLGERPAAVTALRVQAALAAAGNERATFLVLANSGSWILKIRRDLDLTGLAGLPKLRELRELDVTLLHSLLFEKLLGLSPDSQARQENLRYVKSPDEAVSALGHGGQLAVFLNATRPAQVQAIAEGGEVMPQKSTFFYPKLPSGLLFNPLDPAERTDGA